MISQDSLVNLAEAETALKKNGFTILEKPARHTLMTFVDGRNYFGETVADFLVSKAKKNYVVKVLESAALDFTEPALRRVLLEYDYAFDPEAVLAFDPATKELHQVSFAQPGKGLMDKVFQYLIIGFIIAAVIAIICLLVYMKLY